MTMNPTSDGAIELERLHWVVEAGGGSHLLDLIPGVLGTVAIEVDGRVAGRVAKPVRQRTWQEETIEIDGEPVVVAMSWHWPVLHADVFVAGRSVRDRRTLQAARDAAPRPLTKYAA